jgi:ADP-ribose pyrophosphatase
MEDKVQAPRFGREDVEPVERELLYQGAYRLERYRLRHRTYAGGWSETVSREVFTPGDAVAVLPYDPRRGAVVLIEQFRIGAYANGDSPWLLEIVAGRMKPGETPEDVARREAMEEAGCTLGELVRVGKFFPSVGALNEVNHLYVGLVDCDPVGGVHGLAEEHEDIAVRVVTLDAALAALEAGLILSGSAIVTLQWLALNRARFTA